VFRMRRSSEAATNGVRLTGIPASHPCLAVQLMLEYKGVAYVRRDLPNQLHKLVLPLLGYSERTVPVLRIDGRRVQGSTRIARVLEDLVPEPALFPSDPTERQQVEVLEAWVDADLQDTVRTLAQWAAKQDSAALAPIAVASDIPVSPRLLATAMPVFAPLVLATIRIGRDRARRALEKLPASLDRVDAAIGEGVVGGEFPNAADFQLATCVRLASLIDELQPLLDDRPALTLARRIAPDYPGRFTAPLGLSATAQNYGCGRNDVDEY
jgi:glutathione S-transferase